MRTLRIRQLKLRPDHLPGDLENAILRKLHLRSAERLSWEIAKCSLDARKKPDLYYVYTVDVSFQTDSEASRVLKRCRHDPNVTDEIPPVYRFPFPEKLPERSGLRPVIAGAGPAGLFCGLMLARSGLRPVIIERGEPVEDRKKTVEHFWETGVLDPESNVQFGEGGAGTFSDGKLNTSIRDREGLISYILEIFRWAGAPEDILYSAHPHVGTDILGKVVVRIRNEIIEKGGTILFSHKLTDISAPQVDADGPESADRIFDLTIEDLDREKTVRLRTDILVLALGHSARDTFFMLARKNLPMSAKAFAVGVRVQHPQKLIDDALYGADCPYELPAASYKLTESVDGRGVYSFCMCPGGYIVNASSEEGRLAVNGMSLHSRSSGYANSAVVVTVSPQQYAEGHDDDPLCGIRFQRELERKAFLAANGAIPVQTFSDFCRKAGGPDPTVMDEPEIHPCVKGRWAYADVRHILPDNIAGIIEEGMLRFDGRISGFAGESTLLCGLESRTSSPVRIQRGEDCMCLGFPGIYPCGEGAGYAGGIVSAAADGIRVAASIVKDL